MRVCACDASVSLRLVDRLGIDIKQCVSGLIITNGMLLLLLLLRLPALPPLPPLMSSFGGVLLLLFCFSGNYLGYWWQC